MTSSVTSAVSSAEEMTETLEKYGSWVDETNLSGVGMSTSRSCPAISGLIQRQSDEESGLYDSIGPEHIRIMVPAVDDAILPRYLASDTVKSSGGWATRDEEEAEQRRRDSIANYLLHGRTDAIGDRAWTWRRQAGSPNESHPKRFITDSSQSSVESQQDDSEDEGRTDRLVDTLEYQWALKNEKFHFILSEMLINSLEWALAEERVRRPTTHIRKSSSDCFSSIDSTSDTSSTIIKEFLPITERADIFGSELAGCSRSEVVAMMIVDDVNQTVCQTKARNVWKKSLPTKFDRLVSGLERNRYLSTSEELTIGVKQPITDPHQPEDPEKPWVSGSLIPSVVSAHYTALSLPIGGEPVLSPDLDLPDFIATRCPPTRRRADQLTAQRNTCPSCRCCFSADVARRLRLCHYSGCYFCSVCHSNTLMVLPSLVLTAWDFSMRPVCCAARDLLNLIHGVPLFSADHFTPRLKQSLTVLNSVLRLRLQGRLIVDFIEKCRQGTALMRAIARLPHHWFACTPEKAPLFSVADFRLMQAGRMERELRKIVGDCVEHVSLCPLCQARGFFCELCDDKRNVIFPFEIDRVVTCSVCHACFHAKCFHHIPDIPCPRCERRKRRRDIKEIDLADCFHQ